RDESMRGFCRSNAAAPLKRCPTYRNAAAPLKGCPTVVAASVAALLVISQPLVGADPRVGPGRIPLRSTAMRRATAGQAHGSAPTDADLRLIQAVKKQDADAVRALLKQRVDVNAPQGDGATALHWAAQRDDLTIAYLLIRAGARANIADDLGTTPLHVACTNRSGPMVERLLSADANANATLLSGETALMTCARAGDARAVKALLARGADVNAKEHEHHQTALMWAAAQRHPDVVQLLIDARADIRARSLTYPQTVVGEQTQRAGREELNYTVLRGGATPLLFTARAGDAESA